MVVPGDPNGLTKSTPTIAEFFDKNGYFISIPPASWSISATSQSSYVPIEHGFDEMKHFAAYYPGVDTYDDTSWYAHPWFPKFNKEYWDMYQKIVNLNRQEGVAGQPAKRRSPRIDYTLSA